MNATIALCRTFTAVRNTLEVHRKSRPVILRHCAKGNWAKKGDERRKNPKQKEAKAHVECAEPQERQSFAVLFLEIYNCKLKSPTFVTCKSSIVYYVPSVVKGAKESTRMCEKRSWAYISTDTIKSLDNKMKCDWCLTKAVRTPLVIKRNQRSYQEISYVGSEIWLPNAIHGFLRSFLRCHFHGFYAGFPYGFPWMFGQLCPQSPRGPNRDKLQSAQRWATRHHFDLAGEKQINQFETK